MVIVELDVDFCFLSLWSIARGLRDGDHFHKDFGPATIFAVIPPLGLYLSKVVFDASQYQPENV